MAAKDSGSSKAKTTAASKPDASLESDEPTSVGGVVKNPRGSMKEAGVYGLKQSAGYVQEEYLNELRGSRGAKFYREMSDNSPVVGGLLLGYREVAAHLDWRIEEPEDATGNDVAATEFIRDAFEDMEHSFEAFLGQALSELTFGWALHEVVYKKRDDGRLGWDKFPIRAQESLDHWEFGKHGSIEAMIQSDPVTGEQYRIPLKKALLFRTSQMKNNPEGYSMLRPAVVPYQYVRRLQEYEAIGVERDLAGLPVAWVPNEWTTSTDPSKQAALQSAINMVQDVRNNERAGLVLPMIYHESLTNQIDHNKMFDFELLASSGGRQFDTDKIITRYNQQIAMSLLGDFVTLGHDGMGSYALGAVKMDLWVMVVDSICKGIVEEFNERAIKPLLALNGIAYDNAPKLSYGKITNVDLAALVAYVSGLANAGVLTPDEGTEAWLREQGGLPPLDPDVEPIYDRAPIDPITGQPIDPEDPRDPKTGAHIDPETGAPRGLSDAQRRQQEAAAAQAEHAAKNPPRDPNDPEVIEAKKPAPGVKKPAAKKPSSKKD